MEQPGALDVANLGGTEAEVLREASRELPHASGMANQMREPQLDGHQQPKDCSWSACAAYWPSPLGTHERCQASTTLLHPALPEPEDHQQGGEDRASQ
jgi:hypothetical protein